MLKRGTVLLSLGWAVQLVSGYVLNTWLAHVFGAEGLGLYGVAMSILMWIEIGIISGLPTAVQKFTASHPLESGGILRASVRLQAFTTAAIFGFAFLSAPLASRWLGDEQLVGLIRIALWNLWFYGFFFVYLSFQNGLKRFGSQAFLIALYAVSKLTFNVLFVSIFHAISGALAANIAASAFALVVGMMMARGRTAFDIQAPRRGTEIFRFAWPVALYSLVLQLLQNVDLWFVKSHCGSSESGYYYAAGMLAKIPYYLFFALSAVLLPSVSEAMQRNQIDSARRTIREAVRFFCMAALPIALLANRFGRPGLELLFPKDFGQAAAILSVLVWGMTFLAVYFLFTTVLSADNRPRLALWITLTTVFLDVFLNILWVPRFGSIGAAAATTVSVFTGAATAGVWVVRRFGRILSGVSFLRILAASAVMIGLSFLVSPRGLTVVPVVAGLGIVYALVLIGLREVKREDWAWIIGAKS